MGMLSEFKEFAMKGNVMDMAVGVVIGAAFGKIVSALVDGVIMPFVGSISGKGGSLTAALNGEVYKVGNFAQTILDFVIVAFAIFMVVKVINSMKKKEAAAPAAPPAQEVLLTEIRDLLKKQ